ncbi:hypothetical protein GCM10010211_05030 [Streptomyces albospinus]|uniref:Uncharacterized protein n=1 Tax=Streptomyces albospinus TaxID=285515 RepID=A0ABQ2UM62_9ACTN|nr:hypothetical protein GCM10010211_05030 [Streptomyces albospinus]
MRRRRPHHRGPTPRGFVLCETGKRHGAVPVEVSRTSSAAWRNTPGFFRISSTGLMEERQFRPCVVRRSPLASDSRLSTDRPWGSTFEGVLDSRRWTAVEPRALKRAEELNGLAPGG